MITMQLPIRPYSIIDAINRSSLATGSIRGAMIGADADYNGHHVRVWWNEYRQYWIAEYFWGGRRVLARGKFEDCVRAAKREYDREAKGSTAVVECMSEEAMELCKSLGFVSKEEAEAQFKSWHTDLYDQVNMALRYERQFGCPATTFLIKAKSVQEYNAMVEEHMAQFRPKR